MAVSSEVAIYNLALNAVGTRSNISSPTEASREAEVCRLWFSPVRDQVLAASAWPEATEIAYLAERSTRTSDEWVAGEPKPGYSFSYAPPADMLRPQYMSDWSPFLMTAGAIQSNTANAILIYTKRLETVSSWNPELQMAIVYGLAAHICMPLSGKPSRAKVLIDQANALIAAARESAANVSTETFDTVPDWIAARGYGGVVGSRFFYPFGSLLTLASV